MESYKVKQNIIGWTQAYLTPILTIFIIVAFLFSYAKENSPLMLVYLIALIFLVGFRYYKYANRPIEIEVNGDRIKMKSILGKVTEVTFTDITDIELTRRRELFFTIKGNKIRSLNTYKGFDKFLEDAKIKNPDLKLWGFDKK